VTRGVVQGTGRAKRTIKQQGSRRGEVAEASAVPPRQRCISYCSTCRRLRAAKLDHVVVATMRKEVT
jgi:hypothetical protein